MSRVVNSMSNTLAETGNGIASLASMRLVPARSSTTIARVNSSIIWATMLVIVGLCALPIIYFWAIKKPYKSPQAISLEQYASQTYGIANELLTSYYGAPDAWQLVMEGSVMRYQWVHASDPPRVVWDTRNSICGPNAANFAAMQAYIAANSPSGGVVYSNAPGYSVTLGTTPGIKGPTGALVQYRLQLYAGDLRIEALFAPNRFWSPWSTPGNQNPTPWPSAGSSAQIIWALPSATGNTIRAFFTADGELTVATTAFVNELGRTVFWRASVNQPETPIC